MIHRQSSVLRTAVIAAGLALLAGAPVAAAPPTCPLALESHGRCLIGTRLHADAAFASAEDAASGSETRTATWQVGDRFEHDDYLVIREYGRFDLTPPPHGHYYVQVDSAVLLIDASTRLVAERVE